jgi:hypothetical protein
MCGSNFSQASPVRWALALYNIGSKDAGGPGKYATAMFVVDFKRPEEILVSIIFWIAPDF